MALQFDAQTFEMIQGLVFPLVNTLFNFDPALWVGDKAVLFTAVGDGLDEVAELFHVVGAALQDGKLTAEEINTIITEAQDIPAALDNLKASWEDITGGTE